MTGRKVKEPFRLMAEDFDSASPIASTLSGDIGTLRVAVPNDARIIDGVLEWIPGSEESEWWQDGGKSSRALWAFINLSTAKDDVRILEFVRRYGVLGLNHRGLPACGSTEGNEGDTPLRYTSWKAYDVRWEPVSAYRLYAAGLRALVALAVALQRGLYVDPARLFREAAIDLPSDQWERIKQITAYWQTASGFDEEAWWVYEGGGVCHNNLYAISPNSVVQNFTFSDSHYDYLTADQKAYEQRQKFGHWVTRLWLQRSGLEPVLVWDDPGARLCLSLGPNKSDRYARRSHWPPNSLFRVLVAHLAAICRGRAYDACCSNCGAIYYTPRKVRTDQPAYCSSCQATAASRRTQRWRESAAGPHPNLTPTHTPTAANKGEQ